MDRDGPPVGPRRIPGFFWLLLAVPFLVLLAFVPWGRLRGGPPREFPNSIGMRFVRIEPGTLVMGSPEGEEKRDEDEAPHRVKISKGFFLQTTEVTQKQWRAAMGTDPSRFKGDDLPVERVSWDDAADFCRRLGRSEGKKYRLPTEAEWEYACRAGLPTEAARSTVKAGTTGQHAGSGKLEEMGWYRENSEEKTHPVGQKHANAWELYDMHGNVWEWCSDWYGDYAAGETSDPKGPATGTARVLRGGAWNNSPRFCRSAYRGRDTPVNRYTNIGFRAVVD